MLPRVTGVRSWEFQAPVGRRQGRKRDRLEIAHRRGAGAPTTTGRLLDGMPRSQAQWAWRFPAGTSGLRIVRGRETGAARSRQFAALDAPLSRSRSCAGVQWTTLGCDFRPAGTPLCQSGLPLEQASPAEVTNAAGVSVLHPDTPRVVLAGGLAWRRRWCAWQPLSRSDGRCVRDAGIPKAKAVARGTMRSHPRDRLLPTKGITTAATRVSDRGHSITANPVP